MVYRSVESKHGGNHKMLWIRICTSQQHLIGGDFGCGFST